MAEDDKSALPLTAPESAGAPGVALSTTVMAYKGVRVTRAVLWSLSALYVGLAWAMGLVMGSFGPAIVQLAAKSGTSTSTMATLYIAHGLGALIGCIGGGFALRLPRVHPHVTFAIASALFGTTMLTLAYARQFGLLIVVFLLNGLAFGVENVAFNQLLVWLWTGGSPVRDPNAVMQMAHAGFGLGAMVSPGIMAAAGRFEPVFLLLGFICLTLSIWSLFSPRVVYERDTLVLREMFALSQIGDTRDEKVVVVALALVMLFYVAGEVTTGALLHQFALLSGIMSDSGAKLVTALYWACLAIGRCLAVPVMLALQARPPEPTPSQTIIAQIDAPELATIKEARAQRIGAWILRFNVSGSVVFSAILMFFLSLIGAKSALVLVIGAMGMGFSYSTLYPLTMVLPLHFGMILRVPMTSLFTFGDAAGEMMGAAVVARLMSLTSERMLFVGIFAWAALTAIFYLVALKTGARVALRNALLRATDAGIKLDAAGAALPHGVAPEEAEDEASASWDNVQDRSRTADAL